MNFFKLYIGDYQRDTAHLSIAEHGAYLLMLQHYYATERPLPMGKALHRMLRAQGKAEVDAIDAVVSAFWQETPQGLVNARADQEIAKSDHQRSVNREQGKRGGRPKRNRSEQETDSVSDSVPKSVSQSEPNGNPNQTPDTNNQRIPSPPTPSSVTKPDKPPEAARVLLPDWVPQDDWVDFVAMRKAKGKRAPFTAAAEQGIVRQLERLRTDGHDPGEVLRQSTMNGWSGVFAPRPTGNVRPFASRQAEIVAKHFPRIAAKPAQEPSHVAFALG